MSLDSSPPTSPSSQQDKQLSTSSFTDNVTRSQLDLASYMVKQTAAVVGGGLTGGILGITHGAKIGGLRFRAENAHRLPTSTKGWYLYHKSKNYYAMWAGLKEGARSAVKMAFWTGAFVGVEESINRRRRRTSVTGFGGDDTASRLGSSKTPASGDALSTVIASLSIAGAFSAWNRFPLPTAARTARMGLIFGVTYGLAQDAYRLATGKRVGYVEFVTGEARKDKLKG